jgi:hypothetical protein
MFRGKTLQTGICIALVLLAGCSVQQKTCEPPKPLCVANVAIKDAIEASESVLGRMHFAIEKSDPDAGIIRTRPLAGAQFFEFWRSDNVGPFDCVRANLQSIRRIVELNFGRQDRSLLISCTVQTQKLSLPEHEVISSAQAYRMYSRSTPSMQTLKLSAGQKHDMAWVDLGDDTLLAAKILNRIERQLKKPM